MQKLHKSIFNWFAWFSAGAFSFFFWLLVVAIAGFAYFFSEHLIEQQQERITTTASISSKGLANVIDERLLQVQTMFQSVALHHSDRVYALANGGGYPFDFQELASHIKKLLPESEQFAVLDGSGKNVISSEGFYLAKDYQLQLASLMKQPQLDHHTMSFQINQYGEVRYGMLMRLQRGDEVGGLYVRFTFDPYRQLIDDFNTSDFEFLLVDMASKRNVIATASTVGLSEDGERIDETVMENALTVVPIVGADWILIGVHSPKVFEYYAQQVHNTAFGLFFALFLVLLGAFFYLKRLERSKQKMQESMVQDSLFNAGPTILFEKDADSQMRVRYASPNVASLVMSGTKRVSELNAYADLVWESDLPSVRARLFSAMANHLREVTLEYRVKQAGGKRFQWVHDLTRIQYDADGMALGLQSYVTSIHAQKMAEQQSNTVIENAPDAIAVTDRYGVIYRVNTAFEKLFDYDRSELIGHTIEVCINEDASQSLTRFLNNVDEVGNDTIILGMDEPILGLTKEAKELALEVSVSAVDTVEGKQLVHMVRDASLQVEAQRQAVLAKENAEALAKARSRFVAIMSHEIRTPLNGVLGMANLLSTSKLDTQQSTYLDAIETSGQALLRIVNSILDFAKLDEGGVQLEQRSFDIEGVVATTMQMVQTQAQEGSVVVRVNSELTRSPKRIGDEGRLQQVLVNLLDNAIKFSPKGRVDLWLMDGQGAVAEDDERCPVVRFEVRDNGIGIPLDQQNKLFDSFTQADESTTRQYGGTGLGLAICKEIVQLMGGEIGVTSTDGVGSVFWFEIPLTCIHTELQRKPVETLEKEISHAKVKTPVVETPEVAINEHSLQGKTILLVEDDSVNQQVVIAFIHRLGGRVEVAANGIDGLSFWRMRSKLYDLILMDCQMPRMDGYKVTQMIRTEEGLMNVQNPVPIIALTANAMEEDRERCFECGMNDFIAKPVDIDLFNQLVVKWATGRG